MNEYLMRVEAVNFDSFVLDTFDLSTVRGGGLLLLDAPEALSSDVRLKKIYAGASAAVYSFQAGGDDEAKKICIDVEENLHTGPWSEATILVVCEALPVPNAFPAVMRILQNKIRWRQLQSPSVVYPQLKEGSVKIDELDDIRPATEREDMLGPPEPEAGREQGSPMVLSDTTFQRRKYGQDRKRHFYESRGMWDEAPWARDFPVHKGDYVNDFDQLSSHPEKGRVNGKIALLYLDGNKFGRIANSCRTPEEIGAWSSTVQANQNSFLHWLLSVRASGVQTSWHWSGKTRTNSGEEVTKHRALRIETLVWGGDEIIWVVPAWCGWWVLASFFDLYGKLPWRPREPVASVFTTDNTYRLTHGASVVFSHAKAPIRRLLRLAKYLAEQPKKFGTATSDTTAYKNYFTYQVLESFDHLGSDPDTSRQMRMPAILRANSVDSLILPGNDMNIVLDGMEKMRAKFPRGKLHWLLDLYCNHPDSQPDQKAAGELTTAGLTEVFNNLKGFFGSTTTDGALKAAATWMHIAELWDYTRPPDWEWPTDQQEVKT